jgi:toxin ParE1/3/4
LAFEVVRSRASDRDLELLFDHLVEAHQALGDSPGEAFERAAARVRAVESDMERLGKAPRQGTLREDLRLGLRQATRNRAIFYFELDEDREEVRVLAVFFGVQDHLARMLARFGGAV